MLPTNLKKNHLLAICLLVLTTNVALSNGFPLGLGFLNPHLGGWGKYHFGPAVFPFKMMDPNRVDPWLRVRREPVAPAYYGRYSMLDPFDTLMDYAMTDFFEPPRMLTERLWDDWLPEPPRMINEKIREELAPAVREGRRGVPRVHTETRKIKSAAELDKIMEDHNMIMKSIQQAFAGEEPIDKVFDRLSRQMGLGAADPKPALADADGGAVAEKPEKLEQTPAMEGEEEPVLGTYTVWTYSYGPEDEVAAEQTVEPPQATETKETETILGETHAAEENTTIAKEPENEFLISEGEGEGEGERWRDHFFDQDDVADKLSENDLVLPRADHARPSGWGR